MYDKLRNDDRSKKQYQQRNDLANTEVIDTGENSTNDLSELLDYLKTYVVKNGTTELKQKLAESVEIRRDLLRKDVTEIKIMFPFYFADPCIVSFKILCFHSNFEFAFKFKNEFAFNW